jgi:hypothetical protein
MNPPWNWTWLAWTASNASYLSGQGRRHPPTRRGVAASQRIMPPGPSRLVASGAPLILEQPQLHKHPNVITVAPHHLRPVPLGNLSNQDSTRSSRGCDSAAWRAPPRHGEASPLAEFATVYGIGLAARWDALAERISRQISEFGQDEPR